ncbi:MAG: hypothetical protein IVW54_20445 [Candidatus Binataceae bacterium]|nr:hypothetical protein [Candidatus Binataceae bacterium]
MKTSLISLNLLLLTVAFPLTARAARWYEARFCNDMLGCSISNCTVADSSPAEIIDNNGGLGGPNYIEEGANGMVTVHAQNAQTYKIMFHDKKACEAYIAPEWNAAQQRERERENEQRELDKKYQ